MTDRAQSGSDSRSPSRFTDELITYLRPEDGAAIRALAEREGLNVSAAIRRILVRHLRGEVDHTALAQSRSFE